MPQPKPEVQVCKAAGASQGPRVSTTTTVVAGGRTIRCWDTADAPCHSWPKMPREQRSTQAQRARLAQSLVPLSSLLLASGTFLTAHRFAKIRCTRIAMCQAHLANLTKAIPSWSCQLGSKAKPSAWDGAGCRARASAIHTRLSCEGLCLRHRLAQPRGQLRGWVIACVRLSKQ